MSVHTLRGHTFIEYVDLKVSQRGTWAGMN